MSSEELISDLEKIRNTIQSIAVDLIPLDQLQSFLSTFDYIDPYFPPTEYSIYGTEIHDLEEIIWKRPHEFLQGQIEVFQGGIKKSDIKQGDLGDCWLLSTIASLADHSERIWKIFLNPEYSQQNFYRLRICKDGEWQNVTVDNFIPCYVKDGKPVFSKHNENELWVMILEKAYAKAYGSYLALKGGSAKDSFENLTGCPAELFRLKKNKDKIKSGEFWDNLKEWKKSGRCLIAGTKSDTVADDYGGVSANHCYAVSRIEEVNGFKLMRLRNPWGYFEWNGSWSEYSAEWTEEMIEILKPKFDANDGAFWMNFEDFVDNFEDIAVGRLDFSNEKRLKVNIVKDEKYGGFPDNYFVLQVSDVSNILIGMHQEDERSVGVKTHRPYLNLGFVVLNDQLKLVKRIEMTQSLRVVQLELDLEPGTYYIVPISAGNSFNPQNHFEKTPFFGNSGELHPLLKSTLKDIFRKYDKDCDKIMEPLEYINFMEAIGITVNEEQFNEKIRNVYASTDAGLTLQGFYEMFHVSLKNFGEEHIRDWLTKLGYNEFLYSIKSKPVVMSLHSNKSFEVVAEKSTEDIVKKAWTELISNSRTQAGEIDGITAYKIEHDYSATIIIKNDGDYDKMVEVNIIEIENVVRTIRNEPKGTINVPSNSWVIYDHLVCVRGEHSFEYEVEFNVVN
ncbi:hypothetical protein SteCoe_26858 [Stentor coeruleus]|uniref:Calpain catalytic domain-containing protein n=1 Tax=Stentor coeruleus TaxID=5963 RepID=A0A1R2BBW3_9CILI|nr:hypothetical protein SteCoe_26858 [Stentor coeruleus]